MHIWNLSLDAVYKLSGLKHELEIEKNRVLFVQAYVHFIKCTE